MIERELRIANLLKAIELDHLCPSDVIRHIIQTELKELQLDLLIDEEGRYKRDEFSRRSKKVSH